MIQCLYKWIAKRYYLFNLAWTPQTLFLYILSSSYLTTQAFGYCILNLQPLVVRFFILPIGIFYYFRKMENITDYTWFTIEVKPIGKTKTISKILFMFVTSNLFRKQAHLENFFVNKIFLRLLINGIIGGELILNYKFLKPFHHKHKFRQLNECKKIESSFLIVWKNLTIT